MIKRLNVILVLSLLILVSVGAVSAADDMNATLGDDEAISDVYSSDNDDIILESGSHTITAKNYNSYFNYKNGELVSSDVKDGDTIYLDGTFDGGKDGLNFVFRKNVTVVGTASNSMKNSLLTFYSGASGSTVSNLNIQNSKDYFYGIFLNGASNCVIKDCTIKNNGQSSYTICVGNEANYNNVTNNVLQTYGVSYGHGTRSSPAVVVCGSHYNYIGDNAITCDDANAIYLSSYDGGPLKGGLSNFNTIYNNTIKYNVLPTSWSYGIQTMGTNNTIDSNKVIGAYRAISTTEHGNVIVNNVIINVTGADFNNPNVAVGGEYAIVGAKDSIIRNNTIENAKVISSGSAISVIDNSIVENNRIEVVGSGMGIKVSGSNIIVKDNNISTVSGHAIFWEGMLYNITVTGNNISSQRGIGVYAKSTSSKSMPGNITITDNYISTDNAYAIDVRGADSATVNIIDANTFPAGKSQVATPEGVYDSSKPKYIFDEKNPIVITPSNYDDYIDANGRLNSTIKDGNVLYFEGEFRNKICIYVSSAVKITGNNPTFYNTTFRLSSKGVWIDNITIININSQKENAWGVLAYGINGARISNCNIEVVDPNAAYAIYVVESSDVDVINNRLSSSGNYLTYTLLAISAEDCNFLNNTIYTVGTGTVHQFESEHCTDGNTSCIDGDACADGNSLGDNVCTDGDACVDGNSVCTDGNCLDGDACVDGNSVCTDGNCLDGDACVDGNSVCTSGNTIPGNHVLKGVFRTYGILMAYSSGCNVSGNKINATSKLSSVLPFTNSTNSIVGIDSYYNTHNNVISNNEIYVKANDNYIYGVGVAGEVSQHPAAEGKGASNNQFINNSIVLEGTYFAQGIVVGPGSEDTAIIANVVYAKASNYSYAVNLEMSQRSVIEQNNFTLNSDMVYGIEAFSSNGNVINDNNLDIKAKQAYGIALSNVKNNEIMGNTIRNDVTGENITYKITESIDAGIAGVYLRSLSTDNLVSLNNITSSKGYAVIISDDAVNNTISDNYLSSEKGMGNDAVNNTAGNNVVGNYVYIFNLAMADVDVNYLESASITVDVDVDGALVKFYMGIEEIGSAVSSNGSASINYTVDESVVPADYILRAVASKENYLTKEASSTLTVNQGSLNITAQDVSGHAARYSDFVAILKDVNGNGVANITVKFYIKTGREALLGSAKSDKDGVATLNAEVPPLELGNYTIVARVEANDKFNSASDSANIEIKPLIATKITFKGSKIYPGGVLAFLKDANGNPLQNQKVLVKFSNKEISVVTGKDGSVILPTTTRGTFDVNVTYSGDDAYDSASSKSKITFAGAISGNKNYSVYYGNTVTYKVRITGSDGKYVGSGKVVTIKVGSTTYKVKTDKNGYASKSLKLKAGSYTVTASYNGDTVSNKITIKPTLIAKDISKKKAKTTKFTVKLVNKKGKILKNKKITFKFKNKKYTAKTNKKGIATLSLKNLAVGKYTITSSYGGCTISNKITIKK